MKYLKSYKIFESSSEDLLDTINDILLPISDSGIKYNIDNFEKIGLIHIMIDGKGEDIDNCVGHISNYLKDLGYLYFIGREIENETHISIENNFNEKIEKDFLKIIDGVKEFKNPNSDKSRIWINPYNYCLFNQDARDLGSERRDGYLKYDYKIWSFFESKYSIPEINETVRYLVGKHLKLEALTPDVRILNQDRLVGKH